MYRKVAWGMKCVSAYPDVLPAVAAVLLESPDVVCRELQVQGRRFQNLQRHPEHHTNVHVLQNVWLLRSSAQVSRVFNAMHVSAIMTTGPRSSL